MSVWRIKFWWSEDIEGVIALETRPVGWAGWVLGDGGRVTVYNVRVF